MTRLDTRRVVLSCGEASGDLHASGVVGELVERERNLRIEALGGTMCAEAGATILHDYRQYAVVGFGEVIPKLAALIRLEREMKRRIRGASLFIAVDYPGLNLRLARFAHGCGVPVLYYIAPQVWAWGARRARRMAGFVDRLAVILPFEEALFRRAGVQAEYVGHPLVVGANPGYAGESSGHDPTCVAVLPGSREGEVRRHLPVLLRAAAIMKARNRSLHFEIGRSPSVCPGVYREIVSAAGVEPRMNTRTPDLMHRAGLALVASGTATLETALAGTPMVIVYRVSAFNYVLARALIRVAHIGLVNVVLGDGVVPELIQQDANPARIADAALGLLGDGGRRSRMLHEFERLRGLLGGGGGAGRVAEMALELME